MAFEMFSVAHYAGLAMFVLAIITIIVFRKNMRQTKTNKAIRFGLAIVLIGLELSLHMSYILQNKWDIESLPFQLCSLMLLVSAVVLVWKSEHLYDVVFFLGSMGALQALLTPSLDESFPQFRYFHFFLTHIGIVSTSLFILIVEQYRPTFKSILRVEIWLHLLAIPAAITNLVTGHTNFMFLARKPGTASLLDMLAPWPWYLLQLEIIAFALFMMLYGVVKFVDRLVQVRKAKSNH